MMLNTSQRSEVSVGINRSAGGVSVKGPEWSYRLDTALTNNIPLVYFFIPIYSATMKAKMYYYGHNQANLG